MTSSSDPRPWSPLDLGAAPAAAPAAAFAAALLPAEPAEAADAGWLPSLRSRRELDAERAMHVQLDDAYRRGSEEGALTERAHAEAACATALQAVAGAARHLEAVVAEFAHDRERDLQAVAVAVARHIVQHELTIDPLRVGELVRRAIELLPHDHVIEVRLHPDDLRTLGASLESLRPDGRTVRLQWSADPALERGGFVIETPQRIVDGRADVALRALYERLEDE